MIRRHQRAMRNGFRWPKTFTLTQEQLMRSFVLNPAFVELMKAKRR